MNSSDIDTILGQFEGSYIHKIDIDLFCHTISISVKNIESKSVEYHQMIFEDVAAFYFQNNVTSRRTNLEKWENAEISEIHYYEKSENLIQFISEKPNFPDYSAKINFYLEIWVSLLLIEAKSIVIDGKRFLTR